MSGSSDPRPGPQRLPRLPLRHRRADARPRPPGAGPGRHRADRALHPRPGLPHAAGGRLHRGTTVDAAAVDARLHADPLLRPDRGDPVRARGVRSRCRRVDSSTAKARPTGSLVLGRPDYPICLMETKPPRNTDSRYDTGSTSPGGRRRRSRPTERPGEPVVPSQHDQDLLWRVRVRRPGRSWPLLPHREQAALLRGPSPPAGITAVSDADPSCSALRRAIRPRLPFPRCTGSHEQPRALPPLRRP